MRQQLITKAYKTELDPNNKQITYFNGCAGMARKVYNWALDYWIKEHERGEKRTSRFSLGKVLTKLKKKEFSWMYEYPSSVHEYALLNCDQAYQNFFRRVKNGEKPGFPKFKSKKFTKKSFAVRGGISVKETKIKLPVIGWIRLKEHGYIPVNPEKICYATVSEKNGRWYVSVTVEEWIPAYQPIDRVIGVDLGIKSLAVTSEGVFYENPKALYKAEKRLKRLDRWLSRKEKGSSNYKKAKLSRARAYQKVMRIRKHVLNEITTELAKTKSTIVIEDLRVSNMLKNHNLARSISDSSWYEFRRQLEYKCNLYGSKLAVVPAHYTSKMCSNCGAIDEGQTLNDRNYKCDCGLEIDRDLNAAINIRAKHVRSNACGDDSKTNRIPLAASVKQEADSELVYA